MITSHANPKKVSTLFNVDKPIMPKHNQASYIYHSSIRNMKMNRRVSDTTMGLAPRIVRDELRVTKMKKLQLGIQGSTVKQKLCARKH